jgi:hypothetical protein
MKVAKVCTILPGGFDVRFASLLLWCLVPDAGHRVSRLND